MLNLAVFLRIFYQGGFAYNKKILLGSGELVLQVAAQLPLLVAFETSNLAQRPQSRQTVVWNGAKWCEHGSAPSGHDATGGVG